jgi:predicted amino acid-binding ACT domain protein
VVKRNWGLRRTNKAHSDFEGAKVAIREKLLFLAVNATKVHLSTLFDVLKFIVKIDYPHHYRDFSAFAAQVGRQACEEGERVTDITVITLKQLREVGMIKCRYFCR